MVSHRWDLDPGSFRLTSLPDELGGGAAPDSNLWFRGSLALTPGIHQHLWGLFLDTRNHSGLEFFHLVGGSKAKQDMGVLVQK